jgi:hypothetical protein
MGEIVGTAIAKTQPAPATSMSGSIFTRGKR